MYRPTTDGSRNQVRHTSSRLGMWAPRHRAIYLTKPVAIPRIPFPGLSPYTHMRALTRAYIESKTCGLHLQPGSLNVTVSGANITHGLNFTATALTLSISGTISPAAGGSAATVTLSGAAGATTTADGAGNYTFTRIGKTGRTQLLLAARATLSTRALRPLLSRSHVTGLNFTATAQGGQTFSISGTISPPAGGLARQ